MSDDTKDSRVVLVEAMIAIAHSDGDFAEVEKRHIKNLLGFLGLGKASRDYVNHIIDNNLVPMMPTPDQLPDHNMRRFIFLHAIEMAYADGVVHDSEVSHLKKLAKVLELSEEDVDRAWESASALND